MKPVRTAATLSLLAVVLLGVGTAWSRDGNFVTPAQTTPQQILPAPPAAASATTRRELTELHRIQSQRTPAQVMRAVADDRDESIFLFKDLLGSDFTAAAFPVTTAFAARVRADEEPNTAPAKSAFARIRPYNLDKSLRPVCRTKTSNDSYPSGHATTGYLLALMLIDMLPEMREAIFARADDFAHNRLVCGVHYPGDLQAGQLLAYAMHAAMTTNPEYQQELAAARQELRQKLAARLALN